MARLILFFSGHILAFVCAILLQVSFIQPLGEIFFGLNLIYITILILLFFNRIYLFICWVLIGGFLWDYFGAFPFGFMLLALLINVSIMYIISYKVLTNRSIYAFLIYIMVGIFVYNSIVGLTGVLFNTLADMQLVVSLRNLLYISMRQSILVVVASILAYTFWTYIASKLVYRMYRFK